MSIYQPAEPSSSQAQRPRRTLKNTLIEPFSQIKIGVYVLILSIVFLFLTAWLFISAFTQQYAHVMEIFKVVDPSLQWDLVTSDVFTNNIKKLVILLFLYIVILFGVIFRMTHKYHGPLVSIERFIKQITEGDYRRRISLRKGDELQKLAHALNEMATTLEKRHPESLKGFDRRQQHHPELNRGDEA